MNSRSRFLRLGAAVVIFGAFVCGSSALGNGSGSYQFLSLAPGGSYIVTPSMGALAPGSAGINTVDVIALQRHFLGVALLSGCRLTAADANGDTAVNTVDVIATQHSFASSRPGSPTPESLCSIPRAARIRVS